MRLDFSGPPQSILNRLRSTIMNNFFARLNNRILSVLLLIFFLSAPYAAPQDREDLLETSRVIEKFVTSYRGLHFLEDVPRKIQSKTQIEQFLISRINETFSKEEIDGAEQLLKRLDLLPPDYDYFSSMVELMTEQIAGLYDHQEKFMALADWIPIAMQEPILAHELTHALQDQHYGLDNFLSADISNDDKALALASLVEGDASLVMFAYSLDPLGQEVTSIPDYVTFYQEQNALMEAMTPGFAASPLYIKETIMFPYSYGSEFLKDYIIQHGWMEVEKLYRNPPQTTEQVMHPKKFLPEPDLPRDTEILAKQFFGKADSKEKEIATNILGEFTTYLFLRQHLNEEQSRKAAEGWDGDLITLTEKPGEAPMENLRMTFCWDSIQEAEEFLEAFKSYLVNRFGPATLPTDNSRGEEILDRIMRENRISITPRDSIIFITLQFPSD